MRSIENLWKRISDKPRNTREEMEDLREKGLTLLHEGLLYVFETGCKPHDPEI